MLIAVAITLVMMAAVVTLFANITASVRIRRASIEMDGQLRHVRNMLQQDLAGATCPGLTWQRPESNHGYIELIEGIYRDTYPSLLTDGIDMPPENPELDPRVSAIPRNNGATDTNGDGRIDDADITAYLNDPRSLRGVNGLGDYDDILMFTSRNEHEPFVGRAPTTSGTVESPLAEIVWFAIENPSEAENADGFFGEPGMRTIYRRALVIAPWIINPNVPPALRAPGVVEILDPTEFPRDEVTQALAALIRIQDTYDLSVRLEWNAIAGHWKIVANTLADLSKRENRFGHYGINADRTDRAYPFAIASTGVYSGSTQPVRFIEEPTFPPQSFGTLPEATAHVVNQSVLGYSVDPDSYGSSGDRYQFRPFAYVDADGTPATANVMLDDEGRVVRVVHGPVPLWGARRGEDVMLTGVLAFDLRVFDPGAPIYQESTTSTVLEPSDYGWWNIYSPNLGSAQSGAAFVGQGAYVDMGYIYDPVDPNNSRPMPVVPPGQPWVEPWFALPKSVPRALRFWVYDTWSLSYENNGLDEDEDGLIDEGTNGLDDDLQGGVDDIFERETAPPYDKPLRGIQVTLRIYEPDSRQIRQVKVNQHFMVE
jgi:hypothetical protein